MLISSRLMVAVVLLFAISIAVATFIENDFGSETARAAVYNSWWFNLLLFVGIINLSLTIILGRMYRKEKRSIFAFHLAFLLILIGAAITRFFGFEGLMHIRTGELSNQIISSDRYFSLTAENNGHIKSTGKKIYLSALSSNKHKIGLKLDGEHIKAECLQVIPNAVETISPDASGEPVLEVVFSDSNGRQSVVLSQSEPRMIGKTFFTINDSLNVKGVNFSIDSVGIHFRSPSDVTVINMSNQLSESFKGGIYHILKMRSLYSFDSLLAVPQQYFTSGKVSLISSQEENADQLPEAILIKVSSGAQSKILQYFTSENFVNPPLEVQFNQIKAEVSFGPRIINLPFGLRLEQFILERYPGSNSPSSFESRINLVDSRAGINKEQRVYMNNILKYQGYRFYQSSYDTDEKGTIFSVNHDYAGTYVTYAGYLLLAIGIVFSIINKNSRFKKLSTELTRIRAATPSFLIVLFSALLFSQHSATAQQLPDSVLIDEKIAARFGALLIQDPGGRIKPINTLSSEFLRKVSGKTRLMSQNPDQILLGFIAHPEYWQNVPMIKTGHPGILEILKAEGPLISFTEVFNLNSTDNIYLLSNYVNAAYQKKPAARNTFDTEIIRLDERINLCFQVYNGNMLRIFPRLNDPSLTWYSPAELNGQFSGSDSVFVHSIVPLFLQSLSEKSQIGEKITPEEALSAMHNFQKKYGSAITPSVFKVNLEILYNRLNIFDRLGAAYGLAGFILLLFLFITVFLPHIKVGPMIKISKGFIVVFFIFHLAGLAMRWMISDHAPWSNAYESLVYIAFATVAAGLLFSHKSVMALPVTSILAWLILFVAHLNWMDPQITNLVPVLKSYWLLIHVAIITASYGFLAMGALMAAINLILMITQTKSNILQTGRMLSELTVVIEMTLIIGLYLLTIGTFLGGVWANESWGRYWGWDPKETWALVSILIYSFVAHMRLVPGLKGNYLFNLMSLLAFSTIIMTYFGVNYYLSGLHSYAKGDPVPIPVFVYYTLAVIGLIALLAWENQRRLRKTMGIGE
jgi:cytochrome c-type biogenesis protein CcsB